MNGERGFKMRRPLINYPSEEEMKRAQKVARSHGRLGNRMLDIYYAAILGHAVGDALGVPVEFMSREALSREPVCEMMGYGTYPVPAGSWSDDTSMVLATLDSLRGGKVDYDGMMRNFALWVKENKYTPTDVMFDIGGTTARAIEKYLTGEPAESCGCSDAYSNGNGSLMRILPVALFLYAKRYPKKEAMRIIDKTSALTHAHPRSRIACGIFAFVLWELLRNPAKDSIREGLCKASTYYAEEAELKTYEERLIRRIGRVLAKGEKEENCPPMPLCEIKSSGYVVDTLEAVIWCLLTTNDYKSCVLTAVNLGEDTDTIGAIAGSLAAALYGISSIPAPWFDALQKREYIESLCLDSFESWRE